MAASWRGEDVVNNLLCVSVNESYHDQLTGLTWLLWEAEPSGGQPEPDSLHQPFFFVLNEEGQSESPNEATDLGPPHRPN